MAAVRTEIVSATVNATAVEAVSPQSTVEATMEPAAPRGWTAIWQPPEVWQSAIIIALMSVAAAEAVEAASPQSTEEAMMKPTAPRGRTAAYQPPEVWQSATIIALVSTAAAETAEMQHTAEAKRRPRIT